MPPRQAAHKTGTGAMASKGMDGNTVYPSGSTQEANGMTTPAERHTHSATHAARAATRGRNGTHHGHKAEDRLHTAMTAIPATPSQRNTYHGRPVM